MDPKSKNNYVINLFFPQNWIQLSLVKLREEVLWIWPICSKKTKVFFFQYYPHIDLPIMGMAGGTLNKSRERLDKKPDQQFQTQLKKPTVGVTRSEQVHNMQLQLLQDIKLRKKGYQQTKYKCGRFKIANNNNLKGIAKRRDQKRRIEIGSQTIKESIVKINFIIKKINANADFLAQLNNKIGAGNQGRMQRGSAYFPSQDDQKQQSLVNFMAGGIPPSLKNRNTFVESNESEQEKILIERPMHKSLQQKKRKRNINFDDDDEKDDKQLKAPLFNSLKLQKVTSEIITEAPIEEEKKEEQKEEKKEKKKKDELNIMDVVGNLDKE